MIVHTVMLVRRRPETDVTLVEAARLHRSTSTMTEIHTPKRVQTPPLQTAIVFRTLMPLYNTAAVEQLHHVIGDHSTMFW